MAYKSGLKYLLLCVVLPWHLLALSIIKSVCVLVGAEDLSAKYELKKKHLFFRMYRYDVSSMHGREFLVASRNTQRLDAFSFSRQPSVPFHMKGAHLHRYYYDVNDADGSIGFNNEGVCSGMSDYFGYLYLKTKDKVKNPTAHLRALGKIFEKGANPQAIFLQIGYRPLDYLHRYEIDTLLKDHPVSEKIQKIRGLAPGIYKFILSYSEGYPHAVVYIKESEGLGFFYDPNQGVIRLSGRDQAKKLVAILRLEGVEELCCYSYALPGKLARPEMNMLLG